MFILDNVTGDRNISLRLVLVLLLASVLVVAVLGN